MDLPRINPQMLLSLDLSNQSAVSSFRKTASELGFDQEFSDGVLRELSDFQEKTSEEKKSQEKNYLGYLRKELEKMSMELGSECPYSSEELDHITSSFENFQKAAELEGQAVWQGMREELLKQGADEEFIEGMVKEAVATGIGNFLNTAAREAANVYRAVPGISNVGRVLSDVAKVVPHTGKMLKNPGAALEALPEFFRRSHTGSREAAQEIGQAAGKNLAGRTPGFEGVVLDPTSRPVGFQAPGSFGYGGGKDLLPNTRARDFLRKFQQSAGSDLSQMERTSLMDTTGKIEGKMQNRLQQGGDAHLQQKFQELNLNASDVNHPQHQQAKDILAKMHAGDWNDFSAHAGLHPDSGPQLSAAAAGNLRPTDFRGNVPGQNTIEDIRKHTAAMHDTGYSSQTARGYVPSMSPMAKGESPGMGVGQRMAWGAGAGFLSPIPGGTLLGAGAGLLGPWGTTAAVGYGGYRLAKGMFGKDNSTRDVSGELDDRNRAVPFMKNRWAGGVGGALLGVLIANEMQRNGMGNYGMMLPILGGVLGYNYLPGMMNRWKDPYGVGANRIQPGAAEANKQFPITQQ